MILFQDYFHYLLTNKKNILHLFIYGGGVSASLSVMYMCTCVFQYICPDMYVWKPKHLMLSVSLNHCSVLFFETEFLTNPELIN